MRFFGKAIIIFIIFLIYASWFDVSKTLASGDWQYLFKETIQNFSFSPDLSFFWLGPYYQITSKIFVQYLHISWELTEKIWWFWMLLVISFFSSWYLSKVVLKQSKFHFLSILIFLSNSYILMIAGGGQMGVALAYAFSPAVLGSFIELVEVSNFKINFKFLRFAFLFAVQFMFDPRIVYAMIFALFLYLLIFLICQREYKKKIFPFLIYTFASGIIVLVFNSSWIIARLLSKSSNFFVDLSSGSLDSLNFFSFSSFADTLSLLQPNWPENIFGKVYFMRPEFLVLPILAYSSLLFLRNSKPQLKSQNFNNNNEVMEQLSNEKILFFAILGLIGAFLAKGAKEPFSQIFQALFVYMPGFFLFRDPTKFYILIALSYSILIPFSLEKIANKISFPRLDKSHISNAVYILFVLFWCFLIRQSLLGELKGTFRSYSVPSEYVSLKNFLLKDSEYSPVLWVPTHSPFSFYSKTHPFIDASSIFGNTLPSKIPSFFNDKKKKQLFKEKKIKYVVVPKDIEGKIFLEDRKYSEKEYKKTIENLKKISFLIPINHFGEIMVFQVWE